MLKKVDLDEIYINETGIDTEIVTIDKNNMKVSLKQVYEIIHKNVGVQIAMSDILLKTNDAEDINEIVSFVSLEEDKSIDLQLRELWMVFKSVHIVLDDFKNKIACEVCAPTPNAIRIFIQAYHEQRLNKWIYLFYSGVNAGDCNEIELYKYTSEDSDDLDLHSLQKDPFFQYILYSKRNGIIQPGLFVSQYKLSEVNEIPYIREICSIVNNVYIMIQRTKDINSKEIYEKYLTWK